MIDLDGYLFQLTKRADRAEKSKDMGIIGSAQQKNPSKLTYANNPDQTEEDEDVSTPCYITQLVLF